METIKDYIQFAINNGYTKVHILSWIERYPDWDDAEIAMVLRTITSKPFIEAIAKWMIEKIKQIQWEWSFLDIDKIIEEITKDQAIAIREWQLEFFITNLRIWKK